MRASALGIEAQDYMGLSNVFKDATSIRQGGGTTNDWIHDNALVVLAGIKF